MNRAKAWRTIRMRLRTDAVPSSFLASRADKTARLNASAPTFARPRYVV
jgi:hypothetical protein